MIATPAFKAHLRVAPIGDEGVLLLAERASFVLRGHAYRQIVPLIDGRRSAHDIVAAVAGAVEPATAWYALLRLEQAGHIVEHDPAGDRGADAFWLNLGGDPAAAAAALGAAAVRVFADGAACRRVAERFRAALEQFGITAPAGGALAAAAAPGARSDLDVVLTDDYLSDALPGFDAAARAAGRRWLLVRPTGVELLIGPLFRPGAAGCLHCLRHRFGQRHPAQQLAARHAAARHGEALDEETRHKETRHTGAAHGPTAPPGAVSLTATAGCLLAATEVAKALAGIGPALDGLVWSLDLRERSSRTHRLIANPACPVCGVGPQRNALPVRLCRRRVAFDGEGGQRTVPPEAMLEAYQHLVSPLIGVVGSFTRAPGADGVGMNYLVDDVVGGQADTLRSLARRFRGGSAGKGITHAQARASALGEALERYSSQFRGTELRIPATFRELGAAAIHPNRVANYSDRQYRERAAWNARHAPSHYVPEPFDPDARIDWTPLWSLTEQRHKLLPTELLYYGPAWGTGHRQRRRFGAADTNGCAAGSVLEEAVLQGFLELAERDAVAMWWYNRLRRPAVDPASFADPWLAAVAARYAAVEREVVVLDLTNDLGIPVFAGVSHRRHGERILIGFGCHLDARIALQRALTEMCQMLSVDLAGDAAVVAALGNGWLDWATYANQPYLVPDATAPVRTRDDFPHLQCEDLLDGIECCRQRVEAHGMEMLVLDQTRADVAMPVVKVVVPGLLHWWARFGAGRLYDVPVALGWLPAPVAEADLNPVPFIW